MFGEADDRGDLVNRVDPNFDVPILWHGNQSQDRTYQFSLSATRTFANGLEFQAGYTYSDVKDISSYTSSIATSNFGFNAIDAGGDPNNRQLGTSWFEIPHKLSISGTANLPTPQSVPTSITLIYVGQSGQPYSWTVYDALINSEPCLSEARGSIPDKNTCRNPWFNRLDASFRIGLGFVAGGSSTHNITLVGSMFNVLNWLNEDWGLQRSVSFFNTRNSVRIEGYDIANDRPILSYRGPDLDFKESVSALASRWRAKIGLRYAF